MAGESKVLRCAIYTRKSTEHGLELESIPWMPSVRPARPTSRARPRRAGRPCSSAMTIPPIPAATWTGRR